ncbi:hypothetical protein [Kitasatospora sp. NPDC051914]|uniref:hypothetical protein n=1 Tax=Kitasatospora sp. NPDC051914 TaxID=3154945 RepID=UPI003445493D
MSVIITFFTAPGHEAAAAVVERGPGGIFESRTWGNFDPEEALIEWESLLTGRSLDNLLDDGEPETVADLDDGQGPVVLAASRTLQEALTRTDRSRLVRTSQLWVEHRASEGEAIDQEIAEEILQSLADLARSAHGHDDRLYCWTT